MGQRWFESDEDYADRMREESAERTIEESTGSAPHQRWFESEEDYRSRITQEANEHVIENSTGSAPTQRWFESDGDYRERVFEEANSRILEDTTGDAPQQRWFEADEDYRSRVFKEANEATVEDRSGTGPRQRWFEDEGAYKRRAALEARELRARGREHAAAGHSDARQYSSASGWNTGSSENTGSGAGAAAVVLFAVIVVGLLIYVVGQMRSGMTDNGQNNAPSGAVATSSAPVTVAFGSPQTFIVAGHLHDVNERSGPGWNYSILRKIDRGTIVEGIGRAVDSDGWGWIQLADQQGYIKETLLQSTPFSTSTQTEEAAPQANSERVAPAATPSQDCSATGWWVGAILCENPDMAELNRHVVNLNRIYQGTGAQPVFEDTHWQYQVEQHCKNADAPADCLRDALQARMEYLQQIIPQALASNYQSIFKANSQHDWDQHNW